MSASEDTDSPSRRRFQLAAKKAAESGAEEDESFFATFDISAAPAIAGTRHVYSALKKEWTAEPVLVKIEATPFAKGALREAYRCLEIPVDTSHLLTAGTGWKKARKMVAKKFITAPENELESVRGDVICQTVAKHYGNLYNRADPPRKVDFLEASILELPVPDAPAQVYAMEAFVSGDYVKYSNNSGWFDLEENRGTPHTFSHFTYVASQGELMIVDIQGVGVLWTDPVIHFRAAPTPASGDLGLRGMALFLYSHECNKLCEHIGLSPFPLFTKVRPPSLKNWRGLTCDSFQNILGLLPKKPLALFTDPQSLETLESPKTSSPLMSTRSLLTVSTISESASASSDTGPGISRLIEVIPEVIPEQASVDAQIHHMLGRLHILGRIAQLDQAFDPNASTAPDLDAGFWHYQRGAHEGDVSSILALARIYSGSSLDPALQPIVVPENRRLCYAYHLLAAQRKYRPSVALAAEALKSGKRGLSQDWARAAALYELLLQEPGPKPDNLETYEFSDDLIPPRYEILASLAEIYQNGGHGVEEDLAKAYELWNEAAESATENQKGRLAMTYYEKAAECE